MIEPKIFPPISLDVQERLTNQARNRDAKGDAALRTLMVISTRPKSFKLSLFPAGSGNRSEAEFGAN
jgi:hypothetical protein